MISNFRYRALSSPRCIVYSYAQNKYKSNADQKYRWSRMLFRTVAVYGLIGLAFTFALYRGPWIEWLKAATGLRLDQALFNSLGMMAGYPGSGRPGTG